MLGIAAAAAACACGAQWVEISRPWDWASAAARRNSVTPPQRVASTWRQSTAPAAIMRAKYGRS